VCVWWTQRDARISEGSSRALEEKKPAVEDTGEGTTSISLTPAGVNGVRESVKCHAPSGRRIAMRMSSPGLYLKRGTLPPAFGPTAPNGVMLAAG